MLIVPVKPLPSQTINVQLAGQNCTLNIYQKSTGLFMDVLVNGSQIVGGVICQNLNRIVRSLYLGLVGDFCFIDNQEGTADPFYLELGTRFILAYLETTDLPAGEG